MQLRSLLFTLTPREVQSVIEEFEFMREGQSIHYFIDTYDINLYCFPFGLEKKREVDNIYLFSDGQVAYNFLFKNYPFKPILLDEYYDEYSGLRDKVQVVFSNFPALREKVVSFSKELLLTAKISDKLNDFDLIKDKLSIIVSIAIGFSSKNLDTFGELFANRELLTERKLKVYDQHAELNVNSTLFQNLLSEFSILVEEMIKKEMIKGKSENEVENLRIKYRLNSYNDAAVIARTIDTNRLYRNHKKGEQKVFYLISSATLVNQAVSALLSKNVELHSEPILRTKGQLFCKLIFQNEDLIKSIEKLQELKALLEFQSKFGYTSHGHDKLIDSYLVDIEAKRNSFENYAIMLQHADLTSQLGNALRTLGESDTNDVAQLISTLRKADEYIQKNQADVEKWLSLMKLNFTELAYKNDILALIGDDGDSFRVRAYGLDPIESTNHQVPIVFDYRNVKIKSLIKILEEVSFFYTQLHPSEQQIQSFKSSIIEGIRNIQSTTKFSLESQLASYLIYMIVAVPRNHHETEIQTDQYLTPFERGLEFRKRYKFAANLSRDPLIREYDYVMVWAARRSRHYVQSLQLASAGIISYPKDARFYHGASLAVYCMVVDQRDLDLSSVSNISYENAIQYAEQAITLYQSLDYLDVKYTKHSIEVLYNCLAHFYAAMLGNGLSTGERNAHKLVIAKALHNLKLLKNSAGRDFNKYVEYKTTEAYVYFIEYKTFKSVGDGTSIKESIQKLTNCYDLIEKSIIQLEGENKLQHKADRRKFYESLAQEILSELELIKAMK